MVPTKPRSSSGFDAEGILDIPDNGFCSIDENGNSTENTYQVLRSQLDELKKKNVGLRRRLEGVADGIKHLQLESCVDDKWELEVTQVCVSILWPS